MSRVLRLEAIYYIAVVILEVPSGYFSDRFGRRQTLLIACGV
jgi:MFS family permease